MSDRRPIFIALYWGEQIRGNPADAAHRLCMLVRGEYVDIAEFPLAVDSEWHGEPARKRRINARQMRALIRDLVRRLNLSGVALRLLRSSSRPRPARRCASPQTPVP